MVIAVIYHLQSGLSLVICNKVLYWQKFKQEGILHNPCMQNSSMAKDMCFASVKN